MRRPMARLLFLSGVWLLVGVIGAGQAADTEATDLRDQIRAMEGSVKQSSVTHLYTAEQRQTKLDLLAQARREADRGNFNGALERVEQVGQMLYPVGSGDGTALEGKKLREWLESVSEVTAALLPPAYGIVEEKGGGTTKLDRIAQRHEAGVRAWEAGDIDLAEEVIVGAYRDLQTEVAALRSGDLLTIELPSNDTREAWLEAERRYLDWRFTADWMEQSAAALGADPEAIATGSRLAQDIHDEAAAHAARGEWAAEVVRISCCDGDGGVGERGFRR